METYGACVPTKYMLRGASTFLYLYGLGTLDAGASKTHQIYSISFFCLEIGIDGLLNSETGLA